MQETQKMWVWSLGWEDPLEKKMTINSSILAWRLPWTGELDGWQSTGLQRVRHDWVHTHTHTHTHTQSCDYHPGHLATRSLVPIQPRNAVFRDCDYGLELSWETKWRHLDLPHLADKIWGDLLVIDGPCIALIVHDSPEIVTAKMKHEKWSFHSVNSSAPISHDGGHLCVMTHTLQGCFLLSESMWPEKEAIAQELFSRLHIKSKVKLQFDWLFHSNCSIFKKWHNYLGRVM